MKWNPSVLHAQPWKGQVPLGILPAQCCLNLKTNYKLIKKKKVPDSHICQNTPLPKRFLKGTWWCIAKEVPTLQSPFQTPDTDWLSLSTQHSLLPMAKLVLFLEGEHLAAALPPAWLSVHHPQPHQ
jgi:hypothetical protein